MDERSSVAVVGSGVSGLVAAYVLSRTHSVTLFEAEDRLGGHAHTHSVIDPDVGELAIDTGFIVHNTQTYPILRRIFDELGVATVPTEMSMSVRDDAARFHYAGGRGAGGIFAQRRRAVDPRFIAMLVHIKRFHRAAARFLELTDADNLTTFDEFLTRHRFNGYFRKHYAIPLVSCVWSSGADTALVYPARYLFAFLRNHGMLSVTGAPQWYTVAGGSREYVRAIAATIDDVRVATPVRSIARSDGVVVIDSGVSESRTRRDTFNKVVIATHPDDALAMLSDPTPAEKSVLSAFRYTPNRAVLHTDRRFLPPSARAYASWNFVVPEQHSSDNDPPMVTYWMNRLQRLSSPTDYLVTLNPRREIDPRCVIAAMDYAHPSYTPAAVAAQTQLTNCNGATTAFAGAYHGWGFHEDGARAGVAAARHWGAQW